MDIKYGWIIVMFSGGEIALCGKQIHPSKQSAIDFARNHGEIEHLQFLRIKKPS